jgi:hypothetical protein
MYIWYGCTATCKPLFWYSPSISQDPPYGDFAGEATIAFWCWCLVCTPWCMKGRRDAREVYIVKVDHISPTIMINHGDVHQRRFSPLISIGFRIWPTGVFLYACLTLECYVRRGFFDDDLHFFVCEAGVLTCWWILLTKLGCSSH